VLPELGVACMLAAMPNIKDVGTVIQVLRVTRHLSQGELAQRSNVRNSSISNYERGKAEPKLETLQRLSEGLGLPLRAFEETQAFIDKMATFIEDEKGGEGAGREADVEQEAERLAQEAGMIAERLVGFALRLLRSLNDSDPGPGTGDPSASP
jgi:transcriptional regulator with XRE-family HTH domain